MVKSCVYKILNQLINHNPVKSTPLSPAIKYIDQNYFQDISNEMLAKQCSYNEDYFRKQFKKIYGISPKQYLIDRRINVAKQLLTEGILKIHIISKNCGFSNPYHFCRIFKEKN
jgi:AraC-like DNA-binding protein